MRKTKTKIPKCKECNKTNKVVVGTYKDKTSIIAKYWECERCWCVIKKIFDKREDT